MPARSFRMPPQQLRACSCPGPGIAQTRARLWAERVHTRAQAILIVVQMQILLEAERGECQVGPVLPPSVAFTAQLIGEIDGERAWQMDASACLKYTGSAHQVCPQDCQEEAEPRTDTLSGLPTDQS